MSDDLDMILMTTMVGKKGMGGFFLDFIIG